MGSYRAPDAVGVPDKKWIEYCDYDYICEWQYGHPGVSEMKWCEKYGIKDHSYPGASESMIEPLEHKASAEDLFWTRLEKDGYKKSEELCRMKTVKIKLYVAVDQRTNNAECIGAEADKDSDEKHFDVVSLSFRCFDY